MLRSQHDFAPIERLSEKVVREMASDLISAIAERIVREEIDRIKAAIK